MTREFLLTFDWKGLTLAGSLHVPQGTGPHPAVVMAQGSGPADRNSGGYFEPIRQALLDRNVATFAFDKPGCGESSGAWQNHGLRGRADQTIAAIDLIRAHPAIDGDRVGLWGHSQGGWLVQMIAGRPIDLPFAVASSAPTIGVGEQILYDCEQAMRGQGHDDDAVAAAVALSRALHRAAGDGADLATISRELLEPARDQPWYVDFPTIDDVDDWEHVKLLVNERFDPLDALARVQCPFLAVYGGFDSLLPPWQCAEQVGVSLAASGHPDAVVTVFPGGDHRLHRPGTEDFVSGYLGLLGEWVARRAHNI